ncbi:nucleotidyltransferase family protein [Maribacter flavus]|uniref:Nucleotidyltransferase family protein n=1 Tax=Maribacter flavus TaxID=1658664 RepID=A0A5B2TQN6_9FLAO|nr:nucleotidyltransferase family protein [Maribacter flavus]KAA2216931.1 nucleotidyltransferase family protein [Maribacter flavus]
MKSVQNIGVVVLAAGKSGRMQDIKQLLPWKGTFLLQYVLNRVMELEAKRIVVVLGANAQKIKSSLKTDPSSTDIIENATWEKGLGNSIAAGVRYLRETYSPLDGVLICLADQPLVTPDYLNRMLLEFSTQNVSIVASNYGKKMGVPAIFGPDLYDALLKLDSDYGARDILGFNTSVTLGLDAQGLLADIDTPEAYQKIYNENHYS